MEQDIPFLTKVKIVGTMTLVAGVLLAVVAGGVSYQRNAKVEAAKLAKTQLANVEKLKTDLPLFRDTAFGKNYLAAKGEKTMVKVRQEDLPATITAGLDETVSPNPWCGAGYDGGIDWSVRTPDDTLIANSETPNGWGVSAGGSVSIPADAAYGKYVVHYNSGETCGNPEEFTTTNYTYVFKIVPPCPTSVTLTKAP